MKPLTRGLGLRLMIWSTASFVTGVVLLTSSTQILQGIGVQATLWGVIDGIIAAFALFKQDEQEPQKIARILGINVVLDIIYQVIGLVLLVFLWQDDFMVGNGIGIIIQGLFLLILDSYYYRQFKHLIADSS